MTSSACEQMLNASAKGRHKWVSVILQQTANYCHTEGSEESRTSEDAESLRCAQYDNPTECLIICLVIYLSSEDRKVSGNQRQQDQLQQD